MVFKNNQLSPKGQCHHNVRSQAGYLLQRFPAILDMVISNGHQLLHFAKHLPPLIMGNRQLLRFNVNASLPSIFPWTIPERFFKSTNFYPLNVLTSREQHNTYSPRTSRLKSLKGSTLGQNSSSSPKAEPNATSKTFSRHTGNLFK